MSGTRACLGWGRGDEGANDYFPLTMNRRQRHGGMDCSQKMTASGDEMTLRLSARQTAR